MSTKQAFWSKTYLTLLACPGNFLIWRPTLKTLVASPISCTTFVRNDMDFIVHEVSAVDIFACISDQVLELIALCSFKDNYKASSAPRAFNLDGLTLFPLEVWLSSWNVEIVTFACKYIIDKFVVEIIKFLLTFFYIFRPDSHGSFA